MHRYPRSSPQVAHGRPERRVRSHCPARRLAHLLGSAVLWAAALPAQDIGFEGPRFPGGVATPTAQKPQSKLWYNAGHWCGVLWSDAAKGYTIHELDFEHHAWVDRGVVVDTRNNSHCDVKWDGKRLHVASHKYSGSKDNPVLFLRYSYDAGTDSYSLDHGFPVTIGDFSTASLVVDEDSKGTWWAVWTESKQIRVSHTLASDAEWAPSTVLPATHHVAGEDVASVIAYQGDRIGVFWSDQKAKAFHFVFHLDGDPDTAWSAVEDATTGESDNHVNLKTDRTGRIFAACKNGADEVLLLVRGASGGWRRFVVFGAALVRTRPIVLLDEQGRTIHVFATAQHTGEVCEKVSSLDDIAFDAGPGTIRLRDESAVYRISNTTSTKQNVDAATGLVILAHHDTTHCYWHHEVAPVAAAAAAPDPAPPTIKDLVAHLVAF